MKNQRKETASKDDQEKSALGDQRYEGTEWISQKRQLNENGLLRLEERLQRGDMRDVSKTKSYIDRVLKNQLSTPSSNRELKCIK